MINVSREELIEVEGKVLDNLPQGKFKVELDGGHIVVAHVSGKMRIDRKSTRLNSSHRSQSRMPSSA